MSKEAERIAQAVGQQVGVRGDGTYRIIRATLDGGANAYRLVATLPEDCVVWRIRNTDPETLVRISLDNESPTASANDDRSSLIDLEPEQVEAPPIVPALLGKAVRVYAARTGTASQPVLEIIYTTSKNARIMAAVVTGVPPAQLGGTTKASLSGLVVQISGAAVSTSTSGNIIQISGQAVSISGNAVRNSGQTLYLAADSSLGLVYSGIVSFISGAVSGTSVTVGISAPAIQSYDGKYVVDVWHEISGTNLTVNVNRIMAFGTNVRHVSLTAITVSGPTSGVSTVVQGMFRGGVTGELIAVTMGTAVVPYTGEINIYRM